MKFTTSQTEVLQEIQGDNTVLTKNAHEPFIRGSIDFFFAPFFQEVEKHNAMTELRVELEPIQFKQVANFIVGKKLTIELVNGIDTEKATLFIYTDNTRYCTTKTPKQLFELVYMLSQGTYTFYYEEDKIPTWQDIAEL